MSIAPLPLNEQERLAALRSYGILDSNPEPSLQAIAELASQICNTPIAAISFVDEDRVWFKAVVGIALDEIPRDQSFCGYTILQDGPLVVNDALADDRFSKSPLVQVVNGIRFYAGIPLITTDGYQLGSLCVLDLVPRELNEKQFEAIKTLSSCVLNYLDLHSSNKRVSKYVDDLQIAATVFNTASEAIMVTDAENRIVTVNPAFVATTGYSVEDVKGLNPKILSSGRQEKAFYQNMWHQLDEHGHWSGELWNRTKSGVEYAQDLSINVIYYDDATKHMHVGIFKDITDRKHLEEKLQQLIVEQKTMLDNDLIGISRVKDRHLAWVNKAIQRIFGYEAEELLGKSTRILYADDESWERLGAEAYPLLLTHGVYRTQLEMLRRDGARRWIDISGVLLSDTGGESLWVWADITDFKQQESQAAYHDVLTGLPNRKLVIDHLKRGIAHAIRTKRNLVVCYLDLDGFKPINDQYGHEAGDKILVEIALRMQKSIRSNDMVGRFGGDEFVVILSDIEFVDEYRLVLHRLIEQVNLPIPLSDALSVNVGLSIGISLFPNDANEPESLIRNADQAMYQAKKSGRNRICFFTHDNTTNLFL